MTDCSECSEILYLILEFAKVYEKIIFKKIFLFFSWFFRIKKISLQNFIDFWWNLISSRRSEKWILVRNAVREVGQSCPLVLKLSGLVLHTSWAGSESMSEKYLLWVEKFRFFDFTGILCFDRHWKGGFEWKSKNQNFFTQSEYFWLKLSEPAQLVCRTSPESLGTNWQL